MKIEDIQYKFSCFVENDHEDFNIIIEDQNQENMNRLLDTYNPEIVEHAMIDEFIMSMTNEASGSLYDTYYNSSFESDDEYALPNQISYEEECHNDINQEKLDDFLDESTRDSIENDILDKQLSRPAEPRKQRSSNKVEEFKQIFIQITKKYRFIYYNKNLYVYDRNKYLLVGNDVNLGRYLSNDIIYELISTNATQYVALLKQLEMVAPKAEKQDCKTHIPFDDCIYDVKYNREYSHSPDYVSFISLPIQYHSDNKYCPVFDQYIRMVSDGDPEIEELLLTMIGYFLLVNCNDAKKFFVIIGEGGTGKSTLGRVIEALLGSKVCDNVPLQNLNGEYSKAKLDKKIINISMDLSDETIKCQHIAIIKSITGGDKVFTNVKHKDMKSFYTTVKLLFGSNHPLKFEVDDPAFYERLICIPFNVVIPPEMQDKNLSEKIVNERSGIVHRVIPYVSKLFENNMQFPYSEEAERLKRKCINPKASSLKNFIDERCEFSAECKYSAEQLYNDYCEYCYENGLDLLNTKAFYKEMKKYPFMYGRWGVPGEKNKQFYGYKGIKLKETGLSECVDLD